MLPRRYKKRKISEIEKGDSKVTILGRVIERKEDSFVLDDGTGKVEVFFEGEIKPGLARAFCSLVGNQLKADVIQDLKGLDLNLFKKVEDLYNKAGL